MNKCTFHEKQIMNKDYKSWKKFRNHEKGFKIIKKVVNDQTNKDKTQQLSELKEKINSIENCNLKKNSKKIFLGDGDINSEIMLIGEAPGLEEDNSGKTYSW